MIIRNNSFKIFKWEILQTVSYNVIAEISALSFTYSVSYLIKFIKSNDPDVKQEDGYKLMAGFLVL